MSAFVATSRTDWQEQTALVDDSSETSDGLSISVVQTRQAFSALAGQWAALETEVDGAVLFQSSSWARAIFDFETARGNTAFEPVIATISEGSRLVAVLPLERVKTRVRTILAPLGHAFAQYCDVLMAPHLDPRDGVGRLLRAAIATGSYDGVSFLKVRDDSVLARGMPEHRLVTGTEQGAPYVALDRFDDYAGYFATIKPKTRKNLRNSRNRLERDGPLAHVVAANAAETLAVIDRTMEGRAGRLKDQGLSSRAFRDSAFADFCKGLPARPDVELMAMSLRHNDDPIAEQWGFVYKQRYYAFVASRDFERSEESPGKLHLGEVIQACAERGLAGADLMVPVMPYKLTWATEVVSVKDFALPVTPRGALVLNLWDKRLRPLFKQTVLNMPKGIRGLLLKATGRSL